MKFKCDNCETTDEFLNAKDAKENGWIKEEGNWYCDQCKDEDVDFEANDDDFIFGGGE